MKITIRLFELPDNYQGTFSLYMRSDERPLHTVHLMAAPFGTVLQEVSHFLDSNVR